MKTICRTLLLLAMVPVSLHAYGQEGTKTRIGTYDSRAIAIAYAPSKFNPVAENMKAYEKAKAAGDEKRMEELEQWGKKHQRQLHRQGFAIVPVTDLLDHVEDKLPEVAQAAGVVAIVRACDFQSDQVELVDVTDRLVELFDPSEKTLENARSIRTKPPVDLDDLDPAR